MGNEYKFRNYGLGDDLDNRFATDEEMQRLLTKIDLTKNEIQDYGGAPILTDTKTAYVDRDDYHMLILGSTGSMKTRAVILPTVFALASASENMVIADPKGEIYDWTSGTLKKKGYDVRVINLRDMEHSDCWNPFEEPYRLYHAGDREKAVNLANSFVDSLLPPPTGEDSFWQTSGLKAVRGAVKIMLCGGVTPDEVNPGSIPTFYNLYSMKYEDSLKDSVFFSDDLDESENGAPKAGYSQMKEFVSSLSNGNSIRSDLSDILYTAAVTQGGILNHFAVAVDPFTKSQSLKAISSHSTVDLHAFSDPAKKTVLYLITPDEDTSLHFFVANLIKQLYGIAISDANRLPKGRLPRRLNFVLDEFANIPRIPDMSSMITAARSRNIRFFLVVQSDAQLHAKYGDEAEIIKTNCLDWIYLNSKESELINQVSEMCGKKRDGRPLITTQELSTLRKESGINAGADALFLMTRSKPYLTFLPDIGRYKQFALEPPVPLPTTDLHFQVFDQTKRIFALSKEERKRIYDSEETYPRPVKETPDFRSKWDSWGKNSVEGKEDSGIATDDGPYEEGKKYNLEALRADGAVGIEKTLQDGKQCYIVHYSGRADKVISAFIAEIKRYVR